VADITPQDVLAAIANGVMDEHEDRLIQAIKARRRVRSTIETGKALASVKVGSRVSLHGLRPQYLNGLTGVVEEVRGTRFNVKLDHPMFAGKYAAGGKVLVPAATLKVLPEGTPAPKTVGGAIVTSVPVFGDESLDGEYETDELRGLAKVKDL
jgi:hypothetical protein